MQVKPYERELDIGSKPWEEAMWSAVRVASMQSRFDLVNLYVKLEEKSKSYLKSGEMNEGDKFRVPLESGAIFEIAFYNDYSTVIAERANGKREVAISKADSYKKEYRYLIATSSTLEETNLGIGPKAPEEFHKVPANARVGDVFVFDNGQSYVCSVKFDNYKEFKKTCGINNAPKFSDIEYSDGFTIRTDRPSDVQEVYRSLKDPYTWDIKIEPTTVDEFQGYCRQKYDDRFMYIKSKVLEECFEKFPDWRGAMLDKVVDAVVEKRMAIEHPPVKAEVRYAPKDEEFLISLADFEEDKDNV